MESTAVEHFNQDIIKFLNEEMGYDGNLVSRGDFYPKHGAIYWIFDTNKLSEEEAKKNNR
ncbi:MAG: hypothetical protein Q4B43_05760 [Bacteroidota bacterium]|nr:hypothetical protein [Bacteroidota bacterium]